MRISPELGGRDEEAHGRDAHKSIASGTDGYRPIPRSEEAVDALSQKVFQRWGMERRHPIPYLPLCLFL